jgi:hypothetical protein
MIDVQVQASSSPRWLYVVTTEWRDGALVGQATVMAPSTAPGLTWGALLAKQRLRRGEWRGTRLDCGAPTELADGFWGAHG